MIIVAGALFVAASSRAEFLAGCKVWSSRPPLPTREKPLASGSSWRDGTAPLDGCDRHLPFAEYVQPALRTAPDVGQLEDAPANSLKDLP